MNLVVLKQLAYNKSSKGAINISAQAQQTNPKVLNMKNNCERQVYLMMNKIKMIQYIDK